MLFKITSNTTNSAIFTFLNKELGYFLVQLKTATTFDINLFTEELGEAIFKSEATRQKFEAVWRKIETFPTQYRTELADLFHNNQDLDQFFSDKNRSLPNLHNDIKNEFSELTSHLFENTTKLVKIKEKCIETLHKHCEKFKSENGCICIFCGIESLPPHLEGVETNEQWRADNDHLLAQSHYPIYALHPGNLIPICHICNTKAKLAKDLLHDKTARRRMAFYPREESAEKFVQLKLDISDRLFPRAVFSPIEENPNTTEKLVTWNETYRIEERVNGEYAALIEKLDADCHESDVDTFINSFNSKAKKYYKYRNKVNKRFWDHLLYKGLLALNDRNFLESLWLAIQAKKDDSNAKLEFSI